MIKDVPAPFTLQDLLAFLAADQDNRGPDGYRSCREWSEQFGIDPWKMRQVLQEAKAAGVLLIQAGKRERVDGVRQKVALYAFKLEAETK